MSGLCGFDDFFLGCVGIAVGNVLSYSAFFEPGVLKHHAVAQSERLSGNLGYILAFDFDFAAVGIVEAHKQIDKGGFSATRRSDDCNALTALDVERKSLNEGFVFHVREVNVVDIDVAVRIGQFLKTCVGGLILRFEKVENSACRSGRALELGYDARYFVERFGVLRCVGKHARERAD